MLHNFPKASNDFHHSVPSGPFDDMIHPFPKPPYDCHHPSPPSRILDGLLVLGDENFCFIRINVDVNDNRFTTYLHLLVYHDTVRMLTAIREISFP